MEVSLVDRVIGVYTAQEPPCGGARGRNPNYRTERDINCFRGVVRRPAVAIFISIGDWFHIPSTVGRFFEHLVFFSFLSITISHR